MSQSTTQERRILNEIKEVKKKDQSLIKIDFDESNLNSWKCSFKGPEKSPYASLKFEGDLYIPSDYPKGRPTFQFSPLTIPYHINVDDSGVASVSVQWSMNQSCWFFIENVIKMLANPQPTCSMNTERLTLFEKDKKEFEKKATNYLK